MEKILLITGGSSEIGLDLLKRIEGDYKKIYVQYRKMNDDLSQLVKKRKGDLLPIYADFADTSNIKQMIRDIENCGDIPNHIVHLPSPKAYNKQFHKDNWDNFEKGWEICVHSIVEILRKFIPHMTRQHYGRIVFMLTSYTVNYPAKYQSCYVTIKYALLGLMKALSVEYIDKGITVNGVSPDMMETKFLSEIPEIVIRQNAENSPIGRNIYVEEVTPVIVHMLSDLGASFTGQNVAINGGL